MCDVKAGASHGASRSQQLPSAAFSPLSVLWFLQHPPCSCTAQMEQQAKGHCLLELCLADTDPSSLVQGPATILAHPFPSLLTPSRWLSTSALAS